MEHHNEVLIRTWPIPGRLTWSRSPVCADLAPRKRRSRFSPESCARAVRPFGCAGLAPVYLPVSLPCMCRSRPRAFAGRGSVSLLCTRRSRSRVCAGTVSLPSYVRVQLQRLQCAGLAPGVCGPRSRPSLPCSRWSRPCVNAGLAPGFAPARTLVCAGSLPCTHRSRSLVRAGLAPCICGPWFCLALCMRRSRSRVCAGTVSLPSYVRVQLQRLRGSRPGCVRAPLPCLRWSRPCVNAGLAPGFAPARTLVCAGFAPLYAPVLLPCMRGSRPSVFGSRSLYVRVPLPCMCRPRSLVCAGLALAYVLVSPSCRCRSCSRICAGLAPLDVSDSLSCRCRHCSRICTGLAPL